MTTSSSETHRLTDAEQQNLTRWKSPQQFQRPFQEVYYLQWHDPVRKAAGWVRFTLLARKDRSVVGGVWAIFFDGTNFQNKVALKRDFEGSDLQIERDFFYLGMGSNAIFQAGSRGELGSGSRQIRWDLKMEEGESLRHFPTPFYSLPFPKTKITAPHFSTRISGEWSIGGETWHWAGIPGHQAHLWGREMAESWVWGHCGEFQEDPTACFEGLTAQVRIGNRPLRPLTLLFFTWRGKRYAFNSPRQWFVNRSAASLDRWHFEAADSRTMFVGDLKCEPNALGALRYEAPDGSPRFCHATLLADLRIRAFAKGKSGWQQEGVLTAERSSSFEVGRRTHDPAVPLILP